MSLPAHTTASSINSYESDYEKGERRRTTKRTKVHHSGYQAMGEVAGGRENPARVGERNGNKWQVVKCVGCLVMFALLIALLVALGTVMGIMLSGFKSSLDQVKAQMSSPGRFYQNCHQATSSCELTDVNQPNSYTRQCATPYMRVNTTVSVHTQNDTILAALGHRY